MTSYFKLDTPIFLIPRPADNPFGRPVRDDGEDDLDNDSGTGM